jgi:hypothetical protein
MSVIFCCCRFGGRVGGHPSRGESQRRAHQGVGVVSSADARWVYLRGGSGWENHVHIRNRLGAFGVVAGNWNPMFQNTIKVDLIFVVQIISKLI